MFRYILSLGSNVGDGHAHFDDAIAQMRDLGIQVCKESQRIVTPPLVHSEWRTEDHDSYLNAIAVAETQLNPDELYQQCRLIEDAIGHDRGRRWAPRAMDIDLLLFGRLHMGTEGECLGLEQQVWLPWLSESVSCPHSELFNRKFLLDLLSTFGIQLEIRK